MWSNPMRPKAEKTRQMHLSNSNIFKKLMYGRNVDHQKGWDKINTHHNSPLKLLNHKVICNCIPQRNCLWKTFLLIVKFQHVTHQLAKHLKNKNSLLCLSSLECIYITFIFNFKIKTIYPLKRFFFFFLDDSFFFTSHSFYLHSSFVSNSIHALRLLSIEYHVERQHYM